MNEELLMSLPLKFVNNTIEDYAMQVTFDPREGTGKVVYNLSLLNNEDLETAISIFKDAYKSGICVSGLVRFVEGGKKIEDLVVPQGQIAIITMCSSTLDGILLKRGVPLNPIGGGVVEIERRIPRRFTHIILYEYTTIDPLQVLISQEITSITSVMRKGSGNILANIRQCHMEAESLIGEVMDDLAGSSFSGILDVGLPNTPALGVAVDPQYMGIVAVGGTNPIAAIREDGVNIVTHAIKGLMDADSMIEILDY
jgi:repressor of nif and glnA expression